MKRRHTLTPAQRRADEILGRVDHLSDPVVVEVGVAKGDLTRELLSMRKTVRVIAVDNWLPGNRQPESYRVTGDRQANLSFDEQAKRYRRVLELSTRFMGRLSILPISSVEAAELIRPMSVSLVFLDADHSRRGVIEDIEAWRGHAPILGGHDHDARTHPGVVEGVDRIFGDNIELGYARTWWRRTL